MTGFLYAERLVMEELSGESYHMLLVPRRDHGILFCYPKVVGCTQKATLLGTISARLCKHVPEERRAQGAENPRVCCPHCIAKVWYIRHFCQLASHICIKTTWGCFRWFL